MNYSDSQRIESKLQSLGYKSAPESEADLVVVNSCSVRQHAVDKVWGGIRNWKKAGKDIIITGCVVEADRRKFAEREIKFLNISDLASWFGPEGAPFGGGDPREYLSIEPIFDDSKVAFITIMTGCDNFCSYCAVPYTRGREKSRPMDEIIKEVKKALKLGYKEILLLGQNVNSYGNKTKNSNVKTQNYNLILKYKNQNFIALLKSIDQLSGDFKFNFMSSNPQDMTDDLIECFANLQKWPRELHFAMQSGDDEILKKMNRKCTAAQFLELANKLKFACRHSFQNLKLSTDIIVGFPGETKAQFNRTVAICKKIGFYKAYIFKYSPRPGTLASKLVDDVTDAEKKRRYRILNDLINK